MLKTKAARLRPGDRLVAVADACAGQVRRERFECGVGVVLYDREFHAPSVRTSWKRSREIMSAKVSRARMI